MEPLAGVVDTALVGKLDTALLAALAVGTTLLSSFTWVFNFLIHASTQAVASANHDEIGARARVSFSISIIVGLVTAIVLYFFRPWLYDLISDGNIRHDLIDLYFVPRLIGHPFAIVFMTALSILRGLSRVNIALVFVLVTTALNIFLSWLLLYPMNIGLSGAAWGTVLANILGMIACLLVLLREERVRKSAKRIPPKDEWFSFGKNSLNLFGRSLAITGSLFIGSRLAAQQGATTLAAHQILLQVWLFVSFFIDGIAITANIKGAEYSKHKQQENFSQMVRRVLALGCVIGGVFTLLYFVLEHPIQNLFTNDSAVIVLLSGIWPWIALTQIPNSIAFIYDGLLFGLGSLGGFVWVRRWMLCAGILVFLPIALTVDGLNGIWFGLIGMNLFRLVTGFWTTRYLTSKI